MTNIQEIYKKLLFRFPSHSFEVEEKGDVVVITTTSWLTKGDYAKLHRFLVKMFKTEMPEVKKYQVKTKLLS